MALRWRWPAGPPRHRLSSNVNVSVAGLLYLGCYKENMAARTMPTRLGTVNRPSQCYVLAAAAGTTSFAIIGGWECWAVRDKTLGTLHVCMPDSPFLASYY